MAVTEFLTIDGVDITPYMTVGGFKWQRADLDSGESQRLMNGELLRHRVTTKYNVSVKCKPLKTDAASIVLKAIKPPKLTCRYLDPESGTVVERTCYADNVPSQVMVMIDDEPYWDGIEFSLIEY